ncbi:MAG: hypothetical protein RMN25_03350 [Anaerolineae bacterium]|nr:hypothetical protein [Thermoflexales bacterium]MDW8406795.1 hypothetical protein [Anaerolineae bacterium]
MSVLLVLTLVGLVVLGLAGGVWPLPPLQSPIDTPIPTLTVPPSPTRLEPTATPTVTPTITLTPTPGPSPTPDIPATSQSVIATITALAATPTYPPTDTPRPRRTPIIAGPRDATPATTDSVRVETVSEQVFPGGTAALAIRTRAGARCTAQIVREENGAEKLEPLLDASVQTAGRNGVAAWIWTVDRDEPAGIMRVRIDCGEAGTAEARLRVAR